MKKLIAHCSAYLQKILGIEAAITELKNTMGLPFFLHEHYDFYKLELFGVEFAVMVAKSHAELTPAAIRKHVNQIYSKLDLMPIFLCATTNATNRNRLIEYKIPFIIPENQMYLPDLGIDLREHFIKARSKPSMLAPTTQAVLLYIIRRNINGPVTPKELTAKLDYSKMSMSRSIDEIEAADLAIVKMEGKNRLVSFEVNKWDLWKKALPNLKTPVRKSLWLKETGNSSHFYQAGETELSDHSMLTPPKQPTYAIGSVQWKKIRNELEISKFSDEAACKLELWSYDPGIITKPNERRVDPLSLYLSLQDTEDERVEAALEEMMESIEW